MDLTLARLKEILEYDPETGVFRWKKQSGSRAHPGMTAGATAKNGYRLIGVDGTRYYAHRLAWFYVYGKWPTLHLDHINRVQTDNRIANLREATVSQNMANRLAQKNSTHGLKGVSKNRNRWTARIKPPGQKYIHIGTFDTPLEAHAAYCAKASEIYGAFARAA